MGNQTSVTDPAGYTTSVTPNSLSQPQTTTLSNSSLGTFVTTTNTFDNRGLLTGTHTFDGLHALNVTTTLDFNPNGYLSSNNLNTQGAVGSRVLTSSLTYRDNNLVDVVTLGSATRNVKYDSAGRVTCWQYYPNGEYLEYDSSGRRSKLYSDYVPQCNGGDILRTFGYDGFRVISETMAGSVSPPFSYTDPIITTLKAISPKFRRFSVHSQS